MASTYTVNLGIEKIGTGEQSGTWGNTTNTNFDLIDQAVNGAVTVTLASAGTSGSPNTLAITDGASSDGRNKFIEFADGADLGATAYIQLTPNDAEKIVHMRNSLSGGRSVIVFQGTYNASNDFEIPNGKDVVLKFDGGGATATVTQVFEDLLVTAVAATTVDTTNIEVTNLKAKDGTSAGSIADSTGVVTLASSVLTTTDINGGSVDGVTLGTNSAVTEAQIDNININGNTISSTDTNGNVTITPDGTGSVAITKIDVAGGEIDGTAIGGNSASTAVFTDLTASGTVSFSGATISDGGTVTTVNIDGGSIDGTVIGAASTAAGSFTTITASDDVNFDSGTFFVDASADAVGIGTSSPTTKLDVIGNIFLGGSNPFIYLNGSAVDQTATIRNQNGGGASINIDSPTITFSNDTTEHARIDSSGNVGIGTSSPVANTPLTLQAASGYTDILWLKSAGTNIDSRINIAPTGTGIAQVNNTNGTPIAFQISGSEAARIDSSGNVGIGTTSPNSYANLTTLTINGTNGSVADFEVNGTLSGEIFAESNSLKIDAVGASGVLKLLTNSAERMRIDGSGNVGIGTSSPNTRLTIGGYSSANQTPDIQITRSSSGTAIQTGPNITFSDGTTNNTTTLQVTQGRFGVWNYGGGSWIERMSIDSSGNVGIGTTSPGAKLSVFGTTKVGEGVASNTSKLMVNTLSGVAAGIQLFQDANESWIIENPASTTALTFANSGTERMRITSAGNVGIGTTSPASRLEISNADTSADAAGPIFTITNESQSVTAADIALGEIDFVSNDPSSGATGVGGSLGVFSERAFDGGPANTYLSFSTRSSSTVAEKVRITSAGNVGIGTASPEAPIDVEGSGALVANFNGTAANGGYVRFQNNSTSIGDIGAGAQVLSGGTAGDFAITSRSGNLVLGTGTVERARIDTSGRLLVGATSTGSILNNTIELSAAGTNLDQPAYQVYAYPGTSGNSTGYFQFHRSRGSSVGTNTIVASGDRLGMIRWSGANGTDYAPAAEIYVDVDGTPGATDDMPGRIVFATTADGAGTTTERARIDSSGVLSIGTTSGGATALNVQGANSDSYGQLYITATGSGDAQITFETNSNGRGFYVDESDTNKFKIYGGAGKGSNEFVIDNTGNVTIAGSLSKASGSFRIPHPLKPETHELVHSFVEAPQADNLYRGKVDLVAGTATVNIDTVAGMTEGTFALLNREVQCFTSNETGWTAVRGKVDGNILTIEAQDADCTDTISWMVVGERQDPHMYDTEWTDENGKVIVEPLKENEGA